MNKFQKFCTLNHNNDIMVKFVQDIINLLYPDLKDKKIEFTIKTQYDWVVITSTRKKISLGIEYLVSLNGKNIIMSGDKPLSDFETAHFKSKFRIWKFYDDYSYKSYTNEENIIHNKSLNELIKIYNIPKPTPREMFNYYHKN